MKVKPPDLKQIADKNGLPWTAEATASAPSDHGARSALPGLAQSNKATKRGGTKYKAAYVDDHDLQVMNLHNSEQPIPSFRLFLFHALLSGRSTNTTTTTTSPWTDEVEERWLLQLEHLVCSLPLHSWAAVTDCEWYLNVFHTPEEIGKLDITRHSSVHSELCERTGRWSTSGATRVVVGSFNYTEFAFICVNAQEQP